MYTYKDLEVEVVVVGVQDVMKLELFDPLYPARLPALDAEESEEVDRQCVLGTEPNVRS